ncbi:MAG TPA: 2-C-methyl-D-erythritol 2,4-cyclodiphosphate synthase [Deltaproteobacteria bacterium]|nr:2-C-methyl-D-erythritol 2,4-cyclodiphosphate synthase [Deltaproteobacteria bacterium]
MRVGFGYDVHVLTEGRKLLLGGVEIPHNRGLLGHSDADVLLHAISDAILGALSEGDIGLHFPDTDPTLRGIESRKILAHAVGLAGAKGYAIANIDTTIVCQEPKISPFRKAIVDSIATIASLSPDRVSVKAKTTEGLGFAGRGEGIAAYAVCLLEG